MSEQNAKILYSALGKVLSPLRGLASDDDVTGMSVNNMLFSLTSNHISNQLDLIAMPNDLPDEKTVLNHLHMAHNMIKYIHENYRSDISLQDLADYMNFTVQYTCYIFKLYTGKNFRDYLNRYRVEMAKNLLLKENVKIKDLSSQVGCINRSTFTRIFKRYAGMSPCEYKKLYYKQRVL